MLGRVVSRGTLEVMLRPRQERVLWTHITTLLLSHRAPTLRQRGKVASTRKDHPGMQTHMRSQPVPRPLPLLRVRRI